MSILWNEVESIRESEYENWKDWSYVDYAGASLVGSRTLREITEEMIGQHIGNPHSDRRVKDEIDQIRGQLLEFLGVSGIDFCVVFTSGTTASLRLLAESWERGTSGKTLVLPGAVHTSVAGMQGYFSRTVSAEELSTAEGLLSWQAKGIDGLDEVWSRVGLVKDVPDAPDAPVLAVLPAHCNVSGVRFDVEAHSLSLHKNLGAMICVDLGSAPMHDPEVQLRKWEHVDYAVCSFYKWYGYPTGLGALIIRRGAAERRLHPVYLGGGTVEALTLNPMWVAPRASIVERLESGTTPFYEVLSLPAAIRGAKRLGDVNSVHKRLAWLRSWFLNTVRELKHYNGRRVVRVLGESEDSSNFGPTVSFTVWAADGRPRGYAEVAEQAENAKVLLRVGCMCNPTACAAALLWTPEEVRALHQRGKRCGDDVDVASDRPTGLVRVSFGLATLPSDAQAVVELLNRFVELEAPKILSWALPFPSAGIKICQLWVYPLKGAAGLSVDNWSLHETGLALDREWAIEQLHTGTIISSKQRPEILRIVPRIEHDCMVFSHPHVKNDLRWPLEDTSNAPEELLVQKWLHEALGSHSQESSANDTHSKVDIYKWRMVRRRPCTGSFVDRAPLLWVNQASVAELMKRVEESTSIPLLHSEGEHEILEYARRFRPNVVFSGAPAFAEDGWLGSLVSSTKSVVLRMREPCSRCITIGLHPDLAIPSNEPLATLRSFRRGVFPSLSSSSVSFGLYAQIIFAGPDSATISLGESWTLFE